MPLDAEADKRYIFDALSTAAAIAVVEAYPQHHRVDATIVTTIADGARTLTATTREEVLMLSTQLRRTRGTELVLPLRPGSRLRRPCRSPGTRLEDQLHARGRFVVATEHLPGDSVVVRLAGELDYAALAFLDRELRRVEREWERSLLIDAADVTFVDLSVVARLAIAHQRLEGQGGGILVAYPPECLLRLLDLVDEIELPILR